MELREVAVAPVEPGEENRYQRLMAAHHYLGALPKIGETLVRGASAGRVAVNNSGSSGDVTVYPPSTCGVNTSGSL